MFNKQLPSPGIELVSDDGVVNESSPVVGASVSNVDAAVWGIVLTMDGGAVVPSTSANGVVPVWSSTMVVADESIVTSESVDADVSSTSGVAVVVEASVLDETGLSVVTSVESTVSVDDSLDEMLSVEEDVSASGSSGLSVGLIEPSPPGAIADEIFGVESVEVSLPEASVFESVSPDEIVLDDCCEWAVVSSASVDTSCSVVSDVGVT